MSHVFISYAREDYDFAEKTVQLLETRNINVWFDKRDMRGEWPIELERAIEGASALIYIGSPDAREPGRFPRKELLHALDHDIKIVPVFYRERKLPIEIKSLQAVEYQFDRDERNQRYFAHMDDSEYIQELVKRLVDPSKHEQARNTENSTEHANMFRARAEIALIEKNYSMARHHLFLAEKACPPEMNDLLGEILYIRERVKEAEIATQREIAIKEIQTLETYNEEIQKWYSLVLDDKNDFYRLARYALALKQRDASGDHALAVSVIKKARKLEPRLGFPKWMAKHFEWTDQQQQTLVSLMTELSD